MDYKAELKKLIEIVKESSRLAGNKLKSEDIADRLEYKRPYLSQLIGPRGVVNESHILIFKQKFRKELEAAGIPLPGDPANEERALFLAVFEDYVEKMAVIEQVDKTVVEKRVRGKANLILTGLNAGK